MKKYPFVKQLSSKTCAVASLQMIIEYYRGYVSSNYLEELTKTNKNGTTAFHLIEAAKQIGFDSKGLKVSLNDLKNITLPCIVHVTLENSFNHYMVLYSIDFEKKYLIIADPSKKISKWRFDVFEKIWNNIVITFIPLKPMPVFHNKINFRKIILLLHTKLIKPLYKTYLISIVIIILSILSSSSFAVLIDLAVQNISKKVITTLFISFLLIELYKCFFEFLRNKFFIIISHKLDWFLTNEIFSKIISLPYRYYRNHTTGDIVSRINDLKVVKDMSNQILILIMVDIPLMIVCLFILPHISFRLFLLLFILSFIMIVFNIIFNILYNKSIFMIHEQTSIINTNMIEKISGFETIKGLGIENEALNDFKDKYYNMQSTSLSLQKKYNLHSILKLLINDVGSLIIFFVGSLYVLDGKLSIGSLIAFNTLYVYFMNPIKNITDMSLNLKEVKSALKRILELVITEENSGTISKKIVGNIEYKNLNFSYDLINNNLNNINLKIKHGEKVLILGESGSGKSTLMKLLMKDYEVSKNSIFIDGIDINDYTLETLKDNICYVSQNEILFTDSLLNNLKLNRNITNDKINEMLDFCYIRDIFKNSNLGLYTLIEENGFNLSGGERQRIILGRSLLKKFNILIIDEGLNQVDISLERKILKNIFNKYKNKTIIVISHRLENMDLFDHVFKFNKANLVGDMLKNA